MMNCCRELGLLRIAGLCGLGGFSARICPFCSTMLLQEVVLPDWYAGVSRFFSFAYGSGEIFSVRLRFERDYQTISMFCAPGDFVSVAALLSLDLVEPVRLPVRVGMVRVLAIG